jgi:putative ABC transport system permease protein
MSWINRLYNLVRRRGFEDDLDQELKFHLDMREQEHARTGLDEKEARAAALRQFGNVARVREEARRMDMVDWLETLVQDVRCGARQLWRHPASTLTAVLTLALGLGANIALFFVIDAMLLNPLPYRDAGRLVTVVDQFHDSGPAGAGPTVPEYLDFENENRSFEKMAFFDNRDVQLTGGPEPEQVYASRVSASFFPLLGVQAMIGRVFNAEENQPGHNNVAVLSHRVWQNKFGGNRNIVGKQLTNTAGGSYSVIGVLPPTFSFDFANLGVVEPVDLYIPFPMDAVYASRHGPQANVRRVRVLARLKSGVTAEMARSSLRLTADRLKQAYPALYRGRNGKAPDFVVDVRPLKDEIVHDSRLSLNLLLGAVTLILLLASANTLHTRLAQALTRRREFAIRSAIGASRPRLIRQLLVENLLLAILAGVLAMCFAFAVLRIAIAELPEVNPLLLNPSLNPRIFAFAGILLVGITALLGLTSALTSSGRISRLALRSQGASDDPGQGRFRSMLIVGQVALAVVLVIGAGLLVRSLVSLQNTAKGFSADNVLTMRLHLVFTVERTLAQPSQAYQKMLDSIARVPGVMAAAFVTSLPLRGGVPTSFSIPDLDQDAAEASKRIAQYQMASPEYFSVLRIPLIAGRGLSDEDTADRPLVALINQEMVRRFWRGENPVGKTIQVGASRRTIRGVVGDVRLSATQMSSAVQIYVPYLQAYQPDVSLVVRAQSGGIDILPGIRQAIGSVYPNQPIFHVMPMEQVLRDSVAGPRFLAMLAGIMALLSMTIAASGLYGAISYLVARRVPEIAIRMALGAEKSDVLRLVAGRLVSLTALGLAIGITGSILCARLLSKFLFGVRATDPLTFAGTCFLFVLVVAAAAAGPAGRALSTDPAIALRAE